MIDNEGREESNLSTEQFARRDRDPVNVFTRGYLVRKKKGSGEVIVDTANSSQLNDLHFHDYCAGFGKDTWYKQENDRRSINIVHGPIRTLLRRSPIIAGMVILLVFGIAEFRDPPGLSELFAVPMPEAIYLLTIGSIVWFSLFLILIYADLFHWKAALKAGYIYGLLIFLSLCTFYSIYLVIIAENPSELQNVVFVSGFLLVMYIGLLLGYDTMIRTESLFWNLDLTNLISNEEGYTEIKKNIKYDLTRRVVFDTIPLRYLFSLVFLIQFAILWLLTDGPQALSYDVGLIVNLLFDFLLIVGIFQFLVITSYVNKLIRGGILTEHGLVTLKYQPFHPDGHGGFRDVGQAAMRMNAMIILAGLYYSYRLIVQGRRSYEPGLFQEQITLEMLLWFSNFVLPVILYALFALGWIYFIYWRIHVLMSQKKDELLFEKQFQNRKSRAEKNDTLKEPIGGVDDKQGWQDLQNAPEWPIDRRQLTTVLIANVIPITISIIGFPV